MTRTRRELVRLNGATKTSISSESIHPREIFHPQASLSLSDFNNLADESFQGFSARRKRPDPIDFRRQNGQATNFTAKRFKPPIPHPQRLLSSDDLRHQSSSSSQPMFNLVESLSRQDGVASSSTISDQSYNDLEENRLSQTKLFTPSLNSQNVFREENRQDAIDDENVIQRPQNARVALKKNAWSNQTQLCFRPVKPPPNEQISQSRASNHINKRHDPSMARTSLPRPLPPNGYRPLQQNMQWHNMPMSSHPSRMQHYGYGPLQQGTYYHGQFVPTHIVEQELRSQAAVPPIPQDVKPVIARRNAFRNDIEEESEVQHVDRRQALYPGVYEQNDGELYLERWSFCALMTN